MDEIPPVQHAEHEHENIATSLEVEQLDKTLFRSKTLYLPKRARGVFGGQVISQAMVAATNCVDPEFGLHSLHCYFMASASPAIPILYYVEWLREGRTYTTRSVKAVQNGKIIFQLMCSYQKPEPGQPIFHRTMPSVPSPAACVLSEDALEAQFIKPPKGAKGDGKPVKLTDEMRQMILETIAERRKSPIAIMDALTHRSTDGILTQAFWMKAKSVPKYELPFQKCILSYMSDFRFLGVAATELGLSRGRRWPRKLGMMSTLDHTIWFYSSDFDVGDWLLYVINCVAAGNGRATVFGQWFTQAGTLVAVCTQEGVVRVAKEEEKEKVKAKL